MFSPRLMPVWIRPSSPRAAARPARRPRRLGVPEALESRALMAVYTMPLLNNTNLNTSNHPIYVGGASVESNLTLQPSTTPGVLEFRSANDGTDAGKMDSYPLGRGAGQYHTILFASDQTIDSGRIYFFAMASPPPAGQGGPSFEIKVQPTASANYIFEYAELTLFPDKNGGLPTVDVSAVDGFDFPITITPHDSTGAYLGQVGQPLYGAGSYRSEITNAFSSFMSAPGRQMYKPLLNTTSGSILSPTAYLTKVQPGQALPTNAASPLNTVFDAALNSLFNSRNWSLKVPDGSSYVSFNATPNKNAVYGSKINPYTKRPVTLPALEFTNGSTTLNVFNPVGVNVSLDRFGQPLVASTTYGAGVGRRLRGNPSVGDQAGTSNQIVLSQSARFGALKAGMYVFGTPFNAQKDGNGDATNYITNVRRTWQGQTILTLAKPVDSFSVQQVVFSPINDVSTMTVSSGAMVFGASGFFADAAEQGLSGEDATTLSALENELNTALNRGVATVPNSSLTGRRMLQNSPQPVDVTTAWNTETNWYPPGQAQNLYSLFMHTATVGTSPIFTRPNPSANTKGGVPMGMAYGFAYDENPGLGPAGQPQVPSKFDPVPAATTTITITLGPW